MSAKPSLFSDDIMDAATTVDLLPERIRDMHAFYGAGPSGETCGQCRFIQRFKQAATWYKCFNARQTSGPATDWRIRWPACGAFEEQQSQSTEQEQSNVTATEGTEEAKQCKSVRAGDGSGQGWAVRQILSVRHQQP